MPRKGKTNNPNGRPKGSKNKITLELKQVLKNFIFDELKNLPTVLSRLEDKDRAEAVIKLLPFVLPKCDSASFLVGEEQGENMQFL